MKQAMREVNLTQGPIMGRLVRFSLPMIAGNMLQQVYNLVDTLVVGRGIGANALAAVGFANALAPRTPLGVNAIWLAIPIGWALADGAGLWFYTRQKKG